jgi:hypothetical protein
VGSTITWGTDVLVTVAAGRAVGMRVGVAAGRATVIGTHAMSEIVASRTTITDAVSRI